MIETKFIKHVAFLKNIGSIQHDFDFRLLNNVI